MIQNRAVRAAIVWLGPVAILGLLAVLATTPLPDIDLEQTLLSPGIAGGLGTDELGRPMVQRVLQAAPFSLGLAALSAIGAILIGGFAGMLAGWFGGWTDRLIGALIDFFWSMPVAVFAVLVLTIAPPSFISLLLTIVAVNWVSSARIFRAAVLRLRASTFLTAARSRGVSGFDLLMRELAPNLLPLGLLLLGFSAAEALTLEGGLAILGLGPPPPSPSWGGMVSEGLAYVAPAPWIAIAPAAMMICFIGAVRALSNRADRVIFR